MMLPIMVLALGSFVLGLTNFIMAGILPLVSTHFGVTEAQAGYAASIFMLGLCIGAPLFIIIFINFNKKYLLMVAMLLFAFSNTISGITDDFTTLLIVRFIAGVGAGMFIGISIPTAMRFAPAGKSATAVSLVLLGSNIAVAFGVPIGTYLTGAIGYSFTFLFLSVVSIVVLFGVLTLIPKQSTAVMEHTNIMSLFKMVKNVVSDLKASFAVILIATVWGSVFFAYTFITPILRDISLISTDVIQFLLMAFGIGFAVGNILAGKSIDKFGTRSLLLWGAFSTLILYIALYFIINSGNIVFICIGLFFWGAFGYFMMSLLLMSSFRLGSIYGKEAPIIVSALNLIAFNLGMAFFSYLGGLTMKDYGLEMDITVPMLIAGANFILVTIFYYITRNEPLLSKNYS